MEVSGVRLMRINVRHIEGVATVMETWIHASGRAQHNEWEHIYPIEWAWPRGGAPSDYDRGSNFFRVHWETKRPDAPDRVYLHVECPAAAVDPSLNALKVRLVGAVMARDPRLIAVQAGFEYHDNARNSETNMAANKLTSAFSVSLPASWISECGFADMVRVHAALGGLVEAALSEVATSLDSRFASQPRSA